MRFFLETDPYEYRAKRHAFLKAVATRVEALDPEFSDLLRKATEDSPPKLRVKYLRDIHEQERALYQRTLNAMLADINRVLNDSLAKAEGDEPGEEPDDPDYSGDGEPIIDPKTGLTPSEAAQEPPDEETEGEDPDEAEKGLQKATSGPFIGPRGGKWADPAHTIPWVEPAAKPKPSEDPERWKRKTKTLNAKKVHHGFDWSKTETIGTHGDYKLVAAPATDVDPKDDIPFISEVFAVGPDGEVAAALTVADVKELGVLHGDMETHPGHRRKGLMTALHDAAEKKYGKKFIRPTKLGPEFGMTGDAEWFWDKREKREKRDEESSKSLHKAAGAPFIGPRGGKWADAKHTIPWDDAKHGGSGAGGDGDEGAKRGAGEADGGAYKALADWASEQGGKITAHIHDKNKVMLKLPAASVASLHKIKTENKLGGSITVGGHYAMLELDLKEIKAGFATPTKQGNKIGATPPAKKEKPKPTKPKLTLADAQAAGIKIRPHKTDPEKIVLKVALADKDGLAKFAEKYGLKGEITEGANNAMLEVGQGDFASEAKEPEATKPAPEAPKAEPTKPKATKPKKPKAEAAPPKEPEATKPKEPEAKKEATKGIPPKAPIPAKPHKEGGYFDRVEYSEPKTIEEAHAWCESVGIAAKFDNLAVAKAATKAMSTQHPAVLRHMRFVGTPSQLAAWAQENPAINDVAKNESKHAKDLTTGNLLGFGAAAVAHPIGGKPYKHSVVVALDNVLHQASTGKPLTPGGGNTGFSTEAVLTHEFGHVEGFVLRHVTRPSDGKALWEVWKDGIVAVLQDPAQKKELRKALSDYAMTNPHECWAELSVARRAGWKLPESVQKILADMQIDQLDWDKNGAP